MSKQSDSNVIQIDFNAKKKVKKEHGTESFSSLIERVMETKEGHDEWAEDISPRERAEQLKKDLEFLRKMNELPAD
jgi:predicted CopG family antitoxin